MKLLDVCIHLTAAVMVASSFWCLKLNGHEPGNGFSSCPISENIAKSIVKYASEQASSGKDIQIRRISESDSEYRFEVDNCDLGDVACVSKKGGEYSWSHKER